MFYIWNKPILPLCVCHKYTQVVYQWFLYISLLWIFWIFCLTLRFFVQVLQIYPEQGSLCPGESALCVLTFTSTDYPTCYQLDVICQVPQEYWCIFKAAFLSNIQLNFSPYFSHYCFKWSFSANHYTHFSSLPLSRLFRKPHWLGIVMLCSVGRKRKRDSKMNSLLQTKPFQKTKELWQIRSFLKLKVTFMTVM